MATFEPAARELIAALRAPELGLVIANTARQLETFIEQAVKQITYDRDQARLRAAALRAGRDV